MSGFDDNPFADPLPASSTNAPPTGVQTGFLDSYNPFEDTNKSRQSAGGPGQFQPPPFQPAVLPETGESGGPPAYSTVTPQQRISTEELERRQRELENRAADLQQREDEQKRLDAQLKAQNRENNWPPIPSFIPLQPCFYQDIDVDIPMEYRRIVKIGYYIWIAHAALLLINFLGTITYFAASGKPEAGTTFGTSFLFIIIIIPCSFLCWYRPLYKAFKSDSSFNFFTFFFFFLVQCVIMIIQCIGLNWFASCGWINSFSMLGVSVGAGIFMLIIAAGFTALTIIDIMLLVRVHRIYRGTGASFNKAKQEFSTGLVTNPTIRQAAAEAGTSAVRTSLNPETNNRY